LPLPRWPFFLLLLASLAALWTGEQLGTAHERRAPT
jgi:hypothetical protein